MRPLVKAVLAPVCALAGVVAMAVPAEAAFSPNETWTSNPYYGNQAPYGAFADVTGDGRADAVVVNGTGVTVCRSA
ncbi:hypothetical protein ABT147_11840 [Streptomyces sp. NPDC001868]|uniref:hypothetical protein n=1 Tax=Streptomyces sp. NPDC001868 TaxID=3154401 RepID=UPI00332AC2DC